MTEQWFLTRRLAWRLSVVMLGAMALAASAVAWRTVATISSVDDTALRSQVRLIEGQLVPGADGQPVLKLADQLAAVFKADDGDSLFIIYDGAGKAVIASAPDAAATIAPFLPPDTGVGYFRVPGTPSAPSGLLGFVETVGDWRVVVAQANEQSEALVASLLHDFLLSVVWLLLPIGGATVLIGVLTIRHGLRPLHQVSDAAQKVGPNQIGVRLPFSGLPGEILPLVAAINHALARLEQALTAQRRFVDAAAHGLRTPLAVLTARIDAMGDAAPAGDLRADADRLTRLVGQMLTMARLEELPLDRSATLRLRDVAIEAISAVAPLAIRQGVELALIEPTPLAPVVGNRAALVTALTNLLDNALGFAPPGSAVEVVLSAPARMEVRDRGPGVAPEDRPTIFDRFERGLGARPGGSGLGLAIVAEIANAHGGSVAVSGRDGGGAVFTITLAVNAAPPN